MARASPPPEQPEEPALKATKARAKEILDLAREEASELLTAADEVRDHETYVEWTHEVERWDARTKMGLTTAFAGPWPDEFHHAATHVFRIVGQTDDETFEYRKEALGDGIHVLTSIEERMVYLEEPVSQLAPDRVPEIRDTASRPQGGSEVFVVHGHDLALRDRVARLIQRLNLRPVILEEQSSEGLTIIEKFERHAGNVGFAVVLLTADDVGAAAGSVVPEAPNRARQNVVLELGYFMGRLGRSHVAALCTEAVERPSDIAGLVYIDPDREDWQYRLAKEMRTAGLPVDLNDL